MGVMAPKRGGIDAGRLQGVAGRLAAEAAKTLLQRGTTFVAKKIVEKSKIR